jgi:hypothetical protein
MQQKRMRLEPNRKTRKENAIMRKFSTTKGFYDEYFIKLRTAKSNNGSL